MLLVNRAMCHKNRGHWDDVEADSRRALELDPRSMKVGDASHAYFIGTPDHAMQFSAARRTPLPNQILGDTLEESFPCFGNTLPTPTIGN